MTTWKNGSDGFCFPRFGRINLSSLPGLDDPIGGDEAATEEIILLLTCPDAGAPAGHSVLGPSDASSSCFLFLCELKENSFPNFVCLCVEHFNCGTVVPVITNSSTGNVEVELRVHVPPKYPFFGTTKTTIVIRLKPATVHHSAN
ncbi:hypothetical protein TNCV_1502011 [Trichonephila clavipes]|uniref:Uncharacterized protein n=1 Tax=Trichonephila clavipes TaxID=2585209 RepID=A0A8X6V459_TRICX|nr:hypothetical protein TNCV_1502011 [Trichonephila clavipes]